MSAWPLEHSQYLERLVMAGETSATALKAEMEARFGQHFCKPTISRRLRKMGIQIYRSYPMKHRFFELCRQNPEARTVDLVRQYNEETGEDLYQHLAMKWRKSGQQKIAA